MAIVSKRVNGLIPGKEYLLGVKIKNSSIGLSSDMSDVIRFQVPTDQTIPGTVQNFALYQGIESVMFVFDFTSDDDISTHEYELYDSNNSNTGNKISSGFNDANVFTVSVDNLQEDNEGTGLVPYWGRVRAVDTSGNVGEWTDLVQTDSRTPLIDNQFIGSLTAAKITAGTIGAHEIILTQPGTTYSYTPPANMAVLRTSNYQSGSTGWLIRGDGLAEFNNVTVRGAVSGSTIDIGGSDTSSFHVDIDGNMWLGNASYNSAPFKVSSGGALTASGVTVSGQINASSGTFSGSITSTATITGGTIQTASSGQRIVLSGTAFNLYAAGSGDTSTITFNPASTSNYGLITSTGAVKISAQGAIMSIGYYPGDIGTSGVRLESGSYFQVLNGSIDIRRNITTTDWTTANLILRANSGNNNTAIAFKANEGDNNATAQIRVGGGANYFYFRNYNDSANVPIIAAEALFSRTTTASDVNSANIIMDTSAADVSLGFKASNGTYSAQIRLGGSNALFFADGLNSATGVPVNAASYNTFSDYRLKENFEPITDSCSLVKKLNPLKFNFKNKPEEKRIGFIAHELQDVYPFVVTGKKDEISENNKPVYQSVDYGAVTPLLVSAIQEILKRLEILENK